MLNIKIDNIGIIKDSEINVDGITIITGANNSGKTTLGKAVYAAFSATENLLQKLFADKKDYIMTRIDDLWYSLLPTRQVFDIENYNLANQLGKEFKDTIALTPSILDEKSLKRYCDAILKLLRDMMQASDEMLDGIVKNSNSIPENMKLSSNRARIDIAMRDIAGLEKLLDEDTEGLKYADARILSALNQEFFNQITPVRYKDRKGILRVAANHAEIYDIEVKQADKVKEGYFFSGQPVDSVKRAFFISDVDVLDEVAERTMFRSQRHFVLNGIRPDFYEMVQSDSHKKRLIDALIPKDSVYELILDREEAEEVIMAIDKAFDDMLEYRNGKLVCSTYKLDVRNLASGSKMFAIIRTLLLNGQLDANTLLILDEPDTHLHPDWQFLLAEVLTLIQMKLGVKIILTTHCMNLLYGLEYSMKKYRMIDRLRVYQTQKKEDDYMVSYEDMTENLNKIYEDFGKSLFDTRRQELENERI